MEQWWDDGGLAVLNVKTIVAWLLMACLNWWQFSPENIILLLVHGENEVSFTKWLVLDRDVQEKAQRG